MARHHVTGEIDQQELNIALCFVFFSLCVGAFVFAKVYRETGGQAGFSKRADIKDKLR